LDRERHLGLHPARGHTHRSALPGARRQALPLARRCGHHLPIESNAGSIDEIITELDATKIPERSGRAMDHEAEDAFERLRKAGYL
jgi:hypothetical protein